MKRRTFLCQLGIGLLGVAGSAAMPDPLSAARQNRQAEDPIRIIDVHDLDYGRLAALGAPGSVTINASDGTKSLTGGVVDLGGRHRRARMHFGGPAGTGYHIIIPEFFPIIGLGDPSNVAELVDCHLDIPHSGVFPSNGNVKAHVGATLELDAGQPADTYRATIPFIVESDAIG